MDDHGPAPAPAPDLVQFALGGHSLDEARSVYEGGYDGSGFVLEATDEAPAYRYTAIGDHDVTLRTTMLFADGRGTMATGSDVVVSWLAGGSGTFGTGRGSGATPDAIDAVVAERGRPNVYPVGMPFAFHYVDSRINLVHLDSLFLSGLASGEPGDAVGATRFRTTEQLADADLARWNVVLRRVAPVLMDAHTPPVARTEANVALGHAVLATFPRDTGPDPIAATTPRTARTRAAIDFIVANAHLPITPTDIADAAGLTPRGLQDAFARNLDVTPREYLRNVRLDRVRDLLVLADPQRTSIAALAGTWGFAHLGRFSGTYARRFGELPSETLRSRRYL